MAECNKGARKSLAVKKEVKPKEFSRLPSARSENDKTSPAAQQHHRWTCRRIQVP